MHSGCWLRLYFTKSLFNQSIDHLAQERWFSLIDEKHKRRLWELSLPKITSHFKICSRLIVSIIMFIKIIKTSYSGHTDLCALVILIKHIQSSVLLSVNPPIISNSWRLLHFPWQIPTVTYLFPWKNSVEQKGFSVFGPWQNEQRFSPEGDGAEEELVEWAAAAAAGAHRILWRAPSTNTQTSSTGSRPSVG